LGAFFFFFTSFGFLLIFLKSFRKSIFFSAILPSYISNTSPGAGMITSSCDSAMRA
jgi:hypothetical protein